MLFHSATTRRVEQFVKTCGEKYPICLNLVQDSDCQYSNCFFDEHEKTIVIHIRESENDEHTITHELLHGYFSQYCFPNIHTGYSCLGDFITQLSSVVQHKEIYHMQTTYQIDISQFRRDKITSMPLLKKEHSSKPCNSIYDILNIVDVLLISASLRTAVANTIPAFFPEYSHTIFLLEKELVEERILSAEVFRRKTVMVLKILDEYLSQLYQDVQPPVRLLRQVGIDYVPRKSELDMPMTDIFDIHDIGDYFVSVLKKDDSSCHFISKEKDIRQIARGSVENHLSHYQYRTVIID